MINIKKFSWIAALGLVMATSSCTDLDEKVYDRIDASTFYKMHGPGGCLFASGGLQAMWAFFSEIRAVG